MSILLDALRKSENSQKPVELPTIHGNDHQLQEPGSIKSSYVVLLVIVALVLIGWLLWKQYDTGELVYQPPVALPAGKLINNVPVIAGTNKSESGTASQKAVSQKPAAPKSTESKPAPRKPAPRKPAPRQSANQQTAPQQTENTASGRPRTPVETYELTRAEAEAKTAERKAREAGTARARRAGVDNQRRRESAKAVRPKRVSRTSQASEKTGSDGSTRRSSVVDNTVTAADSGAQKKGTNAATQEYQSPEPQPISYWELPDDVRNSVPEMKFSVLVYADQPKDRFVLINGERLIEGDELKPGLVVEHIRRDGVVLTYQLYQFFVAR